MTVVQEIMNSPWLSWAAIANNPTFVFEQRFNPHAIEQAINYGVILLSRGSVVHNGYQSGGMTV